MRSLLDEIVVSDENRAAFERVLGITRAEGGPVRMFMWGPAGSGKSSLLRARWRDKDLLGKRSVICCHAAEIMSAITLGLNDQFLSDIGEVDVLLLDGFEWFFSHEGGSKTAELLLAQRNSAGLSTVIASDRALEELDELDGGSLQDALASYEQVCVWPLDAAGRVEFARRVEAAQREGSDGAPTLDEAACAFVANEFSEKLDDVRLAVQFLVTKAGFDQGATITAEQAKAALAR